MVISNCNSSVFYLVTVLACRYLNGEKLKAEDEKAVVEKLLAYHPHCEDKIGCGLSCIIVRYHLPSTCF